MNQLRASEKSKFILQFLLEIVKVTITALGGLAALLIGNNFAVRNINSTERRLLVERFSKAVELIGSSNPEVCIGGIYSLENVAKESQRAYWPSIQVLAELIKRKSIFNNNNREDQKEIVDASVKAAISVICRRNFKQDPPDSVLDLRNVYLKGVSVSGYKLFVPYLARADLTESILIQVSFTTMDLSKAILWGADLSQAILNEAILREANMEKAILRAADLFGAILDQAVLRGADLKEADLRGASLIEADLRLADLRDANLSEADLRGASLWGANLTGAQIDRANLEQTKLAEAILTNVNLSRANLKKADLTKADIGGNRNQVTDLRGAILTEANLTDTNLEYTDLSWAKLEKSNLTRVNFLGTNLTRANIAGATFKEPRNLTPQQIDSTDNFNQAVGLTSQSQ